MPANLTQEYLAAEQEFRAAREPKDRIEALERMLRVIPKHKGTDHLRGQLRKKLKQLKEDEQQARKGGGGRRADPGHVEQHGAGQVALLGPANAGKSALVAALTNAEPTVAPYPFTTRQPLPGMMAFEDVQIQLVDGPAVGREYYDGWMSSLVRRAQAVLLVLDSGIPGVLDDVEGIIERLETSKVQLRGFLGEAGARTEDDADPQGELDDEAILARLEPGTVWRNSLVVATKIDLAPQREDLEVLEEMLEGRFPVLGVSATTGEGLDELRRTIFDMLGIIRIYSKRPGKAADLGEPNVLPRGATVQDLAQSIHRELAQNLTFARVWGGDYHPGQRVPRDCELEDGLLVELRD